MKCSEQKSFFKKIKGIIKEDELIELALSLDKKEIPRDQRVLHIDQLCITYWNSKVDLEPVPDNGWWFRIHGFDIYVGNEDEMF